MKTVLGFLLFATFLVHVQSLICYDCPSYGAECRKPFDENFGELMECPDSPNAACLSIYRLINTLELGNKELFGRPKIVP